MGVAMEAGRNGHPDVYSGSYLLSGGILVLIVDLLADYGYFALGMLAALTVFLWAAFAVVRLVGSLARRRWRRMASILAAPVVIGSLGWLLHASGFSADKVRFLFWRSGYLAQVASRPGEPAPIQIGVWPWRNYATSLMTGSMQEIDVLVYDSSDQIALPFRSRTEGWFSSADAAGYSNSVIIHPERIESADMFAHHSSVKKIGTHFYIVSAEF